MQTFIVLNKDDMIILNICLKYLRIYYIHVFDKHNCLINWTQVCVIRY